MPFAGTQQRGVEGRTRIVLPFTVSIPPRRLLRLACAVAVDNCAAATGSMFEAGLGNLCDAIAQRRGDTQSTSRPFTLSRALDTLKTTSNVIIIRAVLIVPPEWDRLVSAAISSDEIQIPSPFSSAVAANWEEDIRQTVRVVNAPPEVSPASMCEQLTQDGYQVLSCDGTQLCQGLYRQDAIVAVLRGTKPAPTTYTLPDGRPMHFHHISAKAPPFAPAFEPCSATGPTARGSWVRRPAPASQPATRLTTSAAVPSQPAVAVAVDPHAAPPTAAAPLSLPPPPAQVPPPPPPPHPPRDVAGSLPARSAKSPPVSIREVSGDLQDAAAPDPPVVPATPGEGGGGLARRGRRRGESLVAPVEGAHQPASLGLSLSPPGDGGGRVTRRQGGGSAGLVLPPRQSDRLAFKRGFLIGS